ncbi:MAG: cytochrome c family protein [Hyphomonadaceae bacterium]
MRLAAALAFGLLLSACGQQPAEKSADAPAADAAPAAAAALTPQEIANALVALPEPYNTGDYEAGRRVFAQCRSCHTITADNANRIGPHLHGLWGRASGHVEDFRYSDAMRNAALTWDGPTLDRYLTNPRETVPGTTMVFPGVRDETQRRNLIAYLAVESQR